MKTCDFRRFGWQFFQLNNKIVERSEALVKEDSSIKGAVFTITLAFFVLMGAAQLLSVFEQSFYTKSAAASANQTKEQKQAENPTEKEPLLILNKILGIKTARAASLEYSAKLMTQSHGRVSLPPGKAITFQVGFKNTGNVIWKNNGSEYVSIYNKNKYTDSFRHKFWLSPEQPAKLLNSPVNPGEIGYFKFALQSPDIEGQYIAKFQIASEDTAWIEGGELFLPFISTTAEKQSIAEKNNVETNGQTVPVTAIVPEKRKSSLTEDNPCDDDYHTSSDGSECGSEQSGDSGFSAFKLIQSHNSPLSIQEGEEIEFRVGFKNIGETSWTANNIYLDTDPKTYLLETVRPGALGYFVFKISASDSGEKNLHFELKDKNGNLVKGGLLDITLNITANPTQSTPSYSITSKGPDIRVGIYYTDFDEELIQVTADSPFDIKNKNGEILQSLNAGGMAILNYDNGIYTYNNLQTDSYLRIEPKEKNTILTVASLERRPSWNTSINYNKFRGIIEFRHSNQSDKSWVINELPLEDYLKGVAETSNYAPGEYLKTMTVAARTYALYHYTYPNKHAKDNFIIDDTYDQVYRGYAFEQVMPKLVQAVNSTNGEVVTYNNEVVVTPYFSRSDGRTRSWTEVWSGNHKPWLVSVPTPYDAGKTLWGHGVGMSATDALSRANDGYGYSEIISHYYSGTILQKKY